MGRSSFAGADAYKESGGYKSQHHFQAIGMGCDVRYAKDVIYSDGVNLEDHEARVRSGVTCRVCDVPTVSSAPFQHFSSLSRSTRTLRLVILSPSTPTD